MKERKKERKKERRKERKKEGRKEKDLLPAQENMGFCAESLEDARQLDLFYEEIKKRKKAH